MWFILWTTFAFAEEKRHRVANSTAIAHFFPAKSRTCPLGTETFHSTHCLADPEIYEGETYRMYTGASKGYRKKEHKDEQQDAQQHVKINANAEIAGAGGEEIEQNAEGGEVELEQETVKQGEKQEEERGEEDEKKIEGGGEKTKADTGQGGEGKTERVSAENEEKQTKDAQEDGGEGEGEGEKKETQNEDDLKDGAVGENEEKTEGEGDGEAKEGAEDEHVQDDRKPSKSTRPPLVMSPADYKAQIVKNTPGKESTQSKNTTKTKEESPVKVEPEIPLSDDSPQVPSNSRAAVEETTEKNEDPVIISKRINYASEDKGAVILANNKEAKNAANILNENADKYFQSPCSDRRWIVLQLSEDITVRSIVLANLEQFSSHTKEFQVLGSVDHPTKTWMLLGEFKTKNDKEAQEFELLQPVWVRYLKLRFLSHWGTEPVCTLSLLRVHGDTMLVDLNQAYDDSQRYLEDIAETIKKTKEMSEKVDSTPAATDEPQEEITTDTADSEASVVIEEQDTQAANNNVTEDAEAPADNASDTEPQESLPPEKEDGQGSNASSTEHIVEGDAPTTHKQKATAAEVPSSPKSDPGVSPSDSVNGTSAETTKDETKVPTNASGSPSTSDSQSSEAKVADHVTATTTKVKSLHNKTSANKEAVAAVSRSSSAAANDSKKTAKQSKGTNAGVTRKSPGPDHSWRVLNKTRCDIGNGEASLLTLEACKAACGSTCPFLLYHPNSPLQQNCWIAHADHSIASNCVSADGEWTVFIRPESSEPSAAKVDATAPTQTQDLAATSSEAAATDDKNVTGSDRRTSRDETTKSTAKSAEAASSGKNSGSGAHTDAKKPASSPEVKKAAVDSTKKQHTVAKKANKKAGKPVEKKKANATPKQEGDSSKKSVRKKAVVGDAKGKPDPPTGIGGALASSGAKSIFQKLTNKIVGLEVDQMAMHAYLHQLNSNYTKVIWDMNDSATAAIGNSTLQCRKQHDKLRERLKLINTVQTTLNRTVVNISRRVEALHGRMGELVRELREKSDLDQHRHYTWLTSPFGLGYCNVTHEDFQLMHVVADAESQSQMESQSYRKKIKTVYHQLWDLEFKVREEAASGKQMWNTALDRLSFERLQTRQMLRSMRSQLTDQMHSMINESLDVVTTVLNSSNIAENTSKRKEKANVRRIKALRREVSRLRQTLQSMKKKSKQATTPPTPAELFAAAPSVSIAIGMLTSVLGENRSRPILAFLGLGHLDDEEQGDHTEVDQLSRIVSALFLALVVSVVCSLLSCLGMGVLCIALCCRPCRSYDSLPSLMLPDSACPSPSPRIQREFSPSPISRDQDNDVCKKQLSPAFRLLKDDPAGVTDEKLQ